MWLFLNYELEIVYNKAAALYSMSLLPCRLVEVTEDNRQQQQSGWMQLKTVDLLHIQEVVNIL
jgi:hypothetical protein